ncbi:hypothetical protein BLNAU_16578 [Blattamonas nauphoetae]|uniref:Uncharacterized protein n=1 Tax=Blattamonas nauphoetae TaxID=2049346 RepID=A0ABQ9XAU6_9EUKA|nr:hypothetical protein BLNAU_16578 [Blattamonas nauphoetae]
MDELKEEGTAEDGNDEEDEIDTRSYPPSRHGGPAKSAGQVLINCLDPQVDEEDEEEKAGMPQKKSECLDDHTLFVRVPTLLEIVRGITAPTKGKGEADVDESDLLQLLLHLLSVSVVLSPLTTPSDKKNQKKSKATETNEQKVRLAVSLLDERDGWDVRNAAIQLGVERGDATVVGYEYSSFVCSSSSAMDLIHKLGMKGVMTESIVFLDLNPTSTTICVPTNTQQVSASNSENISTFRSIRHANMRRTNNISLSPNSDADPILRRYAAAVPIDASDTWNIFVFGGVEDVMMDGDLFSIDLSVPAAPKYKLLTQSIDNIPSHRANHRTVAGLGKMWLFDGVTKGDVLLNDLFLLSFEAKKATPHTNTLSPKPPARESFSFCEHSGHLFIFGGAGRGDRMRLSAVISGCTRSSHAVGRSVRARSHAS